MNEAAAINAIRDSHPEETRRPLPDSLQVQLMKRQRLRIKDKLHRIEVA